MSCENKVSFFVKRGYFSERHFHDYREVFVPCGRTDPQGHRALCPTCRKNAKKMRRVERLESSIDADNAWARSAGRAN